MTEQRSRVELNLNTVMNLLTIATVLVVGGASWQASKSGIETNSNAISEMAKNVATLSSMVTELSSDIREEEAWRAAHETTNRDRRTEIAADIASVSTTIRANDDRIDTLEAVSARTSDRVAASEARASELSGSIAALQKSVNEIGNDLRNRQSEQASDIRVIREWIEEQRSRSETSKPALRR